MATATSTAPPTTVGGAEVPVCFSCQQVSTSLQMSCSPIPTFDCDALPLNVLVLNVGYHQSSLHSRRDLPVSQRALHVQRVLQRSQRAEISFSRSEVLLHRRLRGSVLPDVQEVRSENLAGSSGAYLGALLLWWLLSETLPAPHIGRYLNPWCCCCVLLGYNQVQAFGGHYHPACFVCKVCSVPFTDGKYFDSGGDPYCETHFLALLPETRCTCAVLPASRVSRIVRHDLER